MPRIDESVDHRVDPYWAEFVLPEKRRPLAHDRQLCFKLPDPAVSRALLGQFF